jgi:hypothetical protein
MADVKQDFLKECMTETGSIGRIPIDQFNLQMCRVCAQRLCSRSALNESSFDKRAKNWKIVLFDQVPRATDDDPRYERIRAKNFLSFQPKDSMPNPSPRAYEVMETTNVPVAIPPEPKSIPIVNAGIIQIPLPPLPATPSAVPIQTVIEPQPQSPKVTEMSPDLGNTPFSQGTILKPVEEDVVIQPGGSFTFGSDE